MQTKKVITLFSLFTFVFFANAQQETKYYIINYENTAEIPNAVEIFDNYYTYFNNVFHFSKEGPGFKYSVKIFNALNDYQAYVQARTDASSVPNSDAIFLRYDDNSLSELVMLKASILNNDTKFIRQLFIQYIFGFVNEIPAWILAGFPLYFEGTQWEVGRGVFPVAGGNPWLETAKIITKDKNRFLSAMDILSAKSGSYPADQFMPQAYLLAYFFTESRFAHSTRLFFDGLSMLKAKVGGDTFLEYQKEWLPVNVLNETYVSFIAELRSIRDELIDGIAAYSANDTDTAILRFREALKLDEKNSIAMYYIGLSMYKQKRYEVADEWYKKALDGNEINPAYIYWALGTSAVADRRNEEAIEYLNKAKEENPSMFGSRVDSLLSQIQ
ncbi:MAG: tetratricopeptide repeat protein [Treponemataceae bacterium]